MQPSVMSKMGWLTKIATAKMKDRRQCEIPFSMIVQELQGSISSTTCHAMYAFLVTTPLSLLQVKYQNKNLAPFETHLTSIRTFVITLSIRKSLGPLVSYRELFHWHPNLSRAFLAILAQFPHHVHRLGHFVCNRGSILISDHTSVVLPEDRGCSCASAWIIQKFHGTEIDGATTFDYVTVQY